MVEIISKRTELYIKQGKPKFEGMTTAKNMKGWIQGRINKYAKSRELEYEMFFRGIMNAYDYFHPEVIGKTEVESWHGKSSFEIIKELDKLIIIKYQKSDKYSEPKEVRTELTKEELTALIDSINYFKGEEAIDTKVLAMKYSKLLGLEHSGWRKGDNPFFSDRKNHNKLTLALGALDHLDLIEYKGGKTKILNNNLNIQMILE